MMGKNREVAARNRKTALVLLALVLVFYFGFIVNHWS